MDENRVGRMASAYEYLRSVGKAHKQQDIAEKIGTDKANVSRAMKGDEKYLTDRFLCRFNAAFDGIFNEEWLLAGEGEMLVNSGISASIDGSHNQINGHGAHGNFNGCESSAILSERVKSLETLIAEKEALLAEKERLIKVLMEGRK